MKFAVIRTGGKQYVVKEGDSIVVDYLRGDVDTAVELEMLAVGDTEKEEVTLGTPVLKSVAKGTILMQDKGEKVRIARYKAKTRNRKS
ncbi:MAG: 50S ribosomal protein L21 [Microgenomates bacterium OLB22]|nr:MAG: 50S ribosomal protein L21 [Microgenomates bacterium OLB22]